MKTILITGASGGIGEALAWRLAGDGYSLILSARREEKMQIIARDIQVNYKVNVDVISVDLADADGPGQLVDKVKALKHNLYGVVNNAGFGDLGRFIAGDRSKYEAMIALNIRALTLICGGLVPTLVENGDGVIINLASTAAFQAVPNMAVYAATKAYVLSFTEALSEELKGSGVKALALCPGATLSEFQKNAGMKEDEAFFRMTPVGTVEGVARYAARMVKRGRPIIGVPGVVNRLMVGATKIMPRGPVRKIAKRMFEE